jgi:hypothetical protein
MRAQINNENDSDNADENFNNFLKKLNQSKQNSMYFQKFLNF